MRLLLDENLSPRLVPHLAATFGDAAHVFDVLGAAPTDDEVWQFARHDGWIILSKDRDFMDRSWAFGAPPKVIWLRIGNCNNQTVLDVMERHVALIKTFELDPLSTCLVLL